MHDSGEVDAQGYCHPGTRYMIQEMIKDWADNPSPEFFITWLLGAGKSAIMRTMVKTLEQGGNALEGSSASGALPEGTTRLLLFPL